MSDYDRNAAFAQYGAAPARVDQAVVDAGLRAYMVRIYNYMMLGLAITGFAALGVYMLSVTGDASAAMRGANGGVLRVAEGMFLTQIGYTLFVSPLKWAVIFAPLAIVLILSFGAARLSPTASHGMFWLYAALVGVSLATVFLVYTHTSVVRVFFITAAAFGCLSLWGYTTKKDLSGFGSFLIMGVFGILIASIVNIFLASSMLQWLISVVGVLVFAGLTAFDTQRLKNEYVHEMAYADGATVEKSAIFGALSLYINFIAMFQMLLSLFGQREE